MLDMQSVLIEPEAKTHIDGLWPSKVIKVLDPEGFDCQNLLKIAESEGKDISQMHLTVHADYVLYGLETGGGKITAVFISDPHCWTDVPSDWWWKSQRDNESFKDLLRKATDTRSRVRVDVPGVRLLPIPRWYSSTYQWKMIKK
jgi:hypothetical protein